MMVDASNGLEPDQLAELWLKFGTCGDCDYFGIGVTLAASIN
jgi:hypothetical protein